MVHIFIPNTKEMEVVKLQVGDQASYTARPVPTAATTQVSRESSGYGGMHHGPTQEARRPLEHKILRKLG